MKNKTMILTIAAIVVVLLLLAGWIYNFIDNERLLWIIGILSTSGWGLWKFLMKNEQLNAKEHENKYLRSENRALNRALEGKSFDNN